MLSRDGIRAVDRDLEAWVHDTVGDAEVSFAAPGRESGPAGVSLYLFALADPDGARAAVHAPVHVHLRYLVSTWSKDDPQAAHDLLGRLLIAALDHGELEVELNPPDALWSGLDAAPRPGFVLTAQLVHQRVRPPVRRVRYPLEAELLPLRSLLGQILVPMPDTPAVPLGGAFVELLGTDKRAESDHLGRFRFDGVLGADAGERARWRLRVSARGAVREYTLSPPQAPDPAEAPLTLSFPLPEE
ncbi:hypothetical protein [Haliangium sp.]|uniref:hypothetical protein n=1 Tax=Haliangium sp. TaxID=2663208 RepID=UPI003D0C907E